MMFNGIKPGALTGILILGLALCPSVAGAEELTATNMDAVVAKVKADDYLRQGDLDHAIQNYQASLEQDPQLTTAYFNMAIAYYLKNDLVAAAESLHKLLEVDPKDIEAQYNLGCLRLYERKPEQAEFHFMKAKYSCHYDEKFSPLVDQGLVFLHQLKISDPSVQEVILLLLEKGLEPFSSLS